MDLLKKYFPHAFKATDVKSLVIAIIRYDILGAKRMPPTDPDATA